MNRKYNLKITRGVIFHAYSLRNDSWKFRQRHSNQILVQTVGLNVLINGAKVFKETVTL